MSYRIFCYVLDPLVQKIVCCVHIRIIAEHIRNLQPSHQILFCLKIEFTTLLIE